MTVHYYLLRNKLDTQLVLSDAGGEEVIVPPLAEAVVEARFIDDNPPSTAEAAWEPFNGPVPVDPILPFNPLDGMYLRHDRPQYLSEVAKARVRINLGLTVGGAESFVGSLSFGEVGNVVPMLKANGDELHLRDSNDANFNVFRAKAYRFPLGTTIAEEADGKLTLKNSDDSDFTLLQFGGVSNAYPALRRTGVNIEAKLADDSAYTGVIAKTLTSRGASSGLMIESRIGSGSNFLVYNPAGTGLRVHNGAEDILYLSDSGVATFHDNINFAEDANYDIGDSNANRPRDVNVARHGVYGGNVIAGDAAFHGWADKSTMLSPLDGQITLTNNAQDDFTKLNFGGVTQDFPAIKRSGTAINLRLADDSDWAPLEAANARFNGPVHALGSASGRVWLSDGTDLLIAEGAGGASIDLIAGNAVSSYLHFSSSAARSRGYVRYNHADDSLSFATGGSPRWGISNSPGHLTPTGNATQDIGSTVNRVRSVYVGQRIVNNNDLDADGPNFIVNTSAKDSAALAYSVQRAGINVGGMTVSGKLLTYNVNDAGAINYERGSVEWNGNALHLRTDKGGTGSLRGIVIASGVDISFRIADSATASWAINNSGHLIAPTDNAADIGTPTASRPRAIYTTNSIFSGGRIYLGGIDRSSIASLADGNLTLFNNAGTGFGLLQLGGDSAAFPAIKRNGANLEFVTANDAGWVNITAKNVVATGTLTHNGVVLTAGNNIDQVLTVNVNIQLDGTWQDTSIDGLDLAGGTYIVQVYANNFAVGGNLVQETLSGVMSWTSAGTNSTNSDEIALHSAGQGSNDAALFLRTIRSTTGGVLRLQMCGSPTTAASDYVFKFRRVI